MRTSIFAWLCGCAFVPFSRGQGDNCPADGTKMAIFEKDMRDVGAGRQAACAGDDERVCGIVAYFNPAKFKGKRDNLERFRRRSKRQGLWLLAVELQYDMDEFELEVGKHADCVLSVRGKRNEHSMWQKERLLNVGLKALPENACQMVVWPDAEVLFENERWVEELSQFDEALVIQPFEYAIRLPKAVHWVDPQAAPVRESKEEGVRTKGIGFTLNGKDESSRRRILRSPRDHGYTGFAWAARRDFLESINGFYDHGVVGGGDCVMAHAFLGNIPTNLSSRREPYYYRGRFFDKNDGFQVSQSPMARSFEKWANAVFVKTQGKIGFLSGSLLHLWHGDKEDRRYIERHRYLFENHFDPEKDLVLDFVPAVLQDSPHHDHLTEISVQIWKWANPTEERIKLVRALVEAMFKNRNED